MKIEIDLPHQSKAVPTLLTEQSKIRFRCHTAISCFNACCRQADITLTPYDVIRLKDHLGLAVGEFLRGHTVPFEMDRDGLPGIKMKTDADGACLFLTEQGCSVYADRPTSCRYYPLGHLAMHQADSEGEEYHWALIREDYCKGHDEARELTVQEYRKEQDLIFYDEMNKEWFRLILKKRSAGPTIGKPSPMSLQLYFMACYDMERFRKFVFSDGFRNAYTLDDAFYATIESDDVNLMRFGSRFLRQILFGEKTIPERAGAVDARLEQRHEILEMRRKAEIELLRQREAEAMKDAES